MIKIIDSIFEKICLLLGIFIFSQLPMFMQYYVQQMSGRVHELQWQMESMRQMASQSGKSLEVYIQKFMSNQDVDFVSQGRLMQETMYRWQNYSDGLFALEHATVWTKPILFLRYFEWNVGVKTYENFEPGFTLNAEGAVYAAIGIGAGYFLVSLIRLIFKIARGGLKRLTLKFRIP